MIGNRAYTLNDFTITLAIIALLVVAGHEQYFSPTCIESKTVKVIHSVQRRYVQVEYDDGSSDSLYEPTISVGTLMCTKYERK